MGTMGIGPRRTGLLQPRGRHRYGACVALRGGVAENRTLSVFDDFTMGWTQRDRAAAASCLASNGL